MRKYNCTKTKNIFLREHFFGSSNNLWKKYIQYYSFVKDKMKNNNNNTLMVTV